MQLIVCLDDRDGMLFNRRRQSKDKAVCADILELTAGSKLWMNSYSAGQFDPEEKNIIADEVFLEKAGEQDYCFAENADISAYADKVGRVIVYRWNREYPADVRFPTEMFCCRWRLESRDDFTGNSHECITREIYEL